MWRFNLKKCSISIANFAMDFQSAFGFYTITKLLDYNRAHFLFLSYTENTLIIILIYIDKSKIVPYNYTDRSV